MRGAPGRAIGPAPLWRIRHSRAASGAAMVLFLVVSALWLVAAGSARVWDHSTPGCFRPGCPPPQSYAGLHVSQWLGIAGAALTVASFVLVARRAARAERTTVNARQVRRAVVAGFAAALAEVIVVLLVTHVAIVTAPLGFENSGEAGTAIVVLAVAQPALACALAVMWDRFLRLRPGTPRPGTHRGRPWAAVIGLSGMVLSCGAFAAWSLQDGPAPMVINTGLIAGTAWMTNAGAWWPGLFAAMLALTLVAAGCAPGMAPAPEGEVPQVPSAGGRTVAGSRA